MRKLLWIAGGIVALLLALCGGWVVCGDGVVRSAVASAGTEALGVRTDVGAASVSLLGGRCEVRDVVVHNPTGFTEPHFLALRRAELRMPFLGLVAERIEVEQLVLEGLDLRLERRDGTTNADAILARRKPPPASGSGKRFVVHEVVIRDISAHVWVLPIGGEASKTEVAIPELRFRNVTEDGLAVAEIVQAVIDGVLQGLLKAGADVLPKDLIRDIELRLPDDTVVTEIGEGVRTAVENAGQAAADIGKDVGDAASNAVQGAAEALRDLFGK
jgi:hypothetical protein